MTDKIKIDSGFANRMKNGAFIRKGEWTEDEREAIVRWISSHDQNLILRHVTPDIL